MVGWSPMPLPQETFFVTCAPGLEALLHAELRALRLAKLESQVGGARFQGTIEDAWRVNLKSRVGVRVLLRLARFEAATGDELHAGATSVDWSRFLNSDGTFRVDAQSSESALDHTLFVQQRVKDAVADSFRERTGIRPSVDLEDPHLSIHVHLHRDRCTLSADTSGDSLHKRGWRQFQGRAPLAETLAAAIVLQSGWDRRSPLLDPFCGSGTVLIEAALLAGGVAPGTFRKRFGFERWPGHDAERWHASVAEARAQVRFPPKLMLIGSDADPKSVDGARENLRSAGLEERIRIEVGDVDAFRPKPGWNAWIVTNPPYGERVGREADLAPIYRRFGAILRERCAGYHVAVLSGNPVLAQHIGLKPDKRMRMKNGALECELLELAIPTSAAPPRPNA
jgi:23S rRNA (guanine2445-N2)-methyltransferase